MVTKTQKTHRNKQILIRGNMRVPPWNGQYNVTSDQRLDFLTLDKPEFPDDVII